MRHRSKIWSFIRKVLNRTGIPFLLIRNPKNRPILAVNIELRPAVEHALVNGVRSRTDVRENALIKKGFLPSSSRRASYPP